MRTFPLVLLALIAVATPLTAQVGAVQQGAVVRATLTAGGREPLVGTLLTRTADSMTIVTRGTEGIIRLPNSAVTSLEVMNGKERMPTAVRWGLVGGGVWGLASAFFPFDRCAVRRSDYCADSRGQFMATQAIGMTVIAGVVGAIRGQDRWVRIEGSGPTAFVAPSTHGTSVGVRFGY